MQGRNPAGASLISLYFATPSGSKYKAELTFFLEILRKLNKLFNHIICCVLLNYVLVYKLDKIIWRKNDKYKYFKVI